MPNLPFQYGTKIQDLIRDLLDVDALTERQQSAVERWNANNQRLEEFLAIPQSSGGGGVPEATWKLLQGESQLTVASGDFVDVSIDIPQGGDGVTVNWTFFLISGDLVSSYAGATSVICDGSDQYDWNWTIPGFAADQGSVSGTAIPVFKPDTSLVVRIYNSGSNDFLASVSLTATACTLAS